jgi:hypothetical protein
MFVVAVTTVAGCHDDPPPPGTTAVTLATSDVPYLFLAVRDGNGPWTSLSPTATTIDVHDDYQLIAACGDATNGFETVIQGATVDDGDHLEFPCFGFGTTPTVVAVTGTMVQAGTVAIGIAQSSTTASWPFEFDVEAAPHALLAIGDNNKAIVQRDLQITADTTLPTVDTSSGTATTPIAYTLTSAAAGANLTSRLLASIGPEFMFMDESPSTSVQTVPASLLEAGDFQHVELDAETATSIQFATVDPANSSATSIDLMPALTGVTFTDGQAAWTTTLPDGDVELDAFDFADVPSFTHIQATAAWLGAQTQLALDTSDVPGFQAEWRADTKVENLSLAVTTTTANAFVGSEAFPPATLAAPVARSFRAHRRSPDRRPGR